MTPCRGGRSWRALACVGLLFALAASSVSCDADFDAWTAPRNPGDELPLATNGGGDNGVLPYSAEPLGDWDKSYKDDGGIQQVHVSLAPQADTPGGLVVSFASSTLASQAGVRFHTSESQDERTAYAKATNYTHTTVANGGRYESPNLYHTLLDAKCTDCTLYYTPFLSESAEAPASGAMADGQRSVRIPALPSAFGGDVDQRFKLALVGDLGQTTNSIQTMQHVTDEEDSIAALLIMGDLSYADNDDNRWDVWGRMFEHVLDHIPMTGLPGNHEIETDDWDGTSFRPYAHRFQNMPNCATCGGFVDPDGGWRANMWHSFDIGSAHIIHVSSYHPYAAGTPQYTWLEEDLASVDRAKTPWIFVNLHAPWYNSNIAHQGEYQSYEVKKAWQPLLCAAGVNIMFAGHVHSYERIFPTCDNSTINAQTGITYINIGDGGNREGLYNHWLPGENGRRGPVWSAFREGSYGHGTLEVFNSTHALWEWHRNLDGDKVTRDSTWVLNYRNGDVGAEEEAAARAAERESAAKEIAAQEQKPSQHQQRSAAVFGISAVVQVGITAYAVTMTVLYMRLRRARRPLTKYENIELDSVEL